MLAIAKRAKASNETLYRWYGNKQTLFQSLIQSNAEQVASVLKTQIQTGADPLTCLALVGPLLLELVTSDKAIALNRAAAADAGETGVLGQSIAQAGRNRVAPLIGQVLAQAKAAGLINTPGSESLAPIADTYISLLIGDLQIRRVIGAIEPLTPDERQQRADRSLSQLLTLYGPRDIRQEADTRD